MGDTYERYNQVVKVMPEMDIHTRKKKRGVFARRSLEAWWRFRQLPWLFLGILFVVALIPILWSLSRTGDWEGAALNFGSEITGAVVTYIILDLVLSVRQEKRSLIRRMGSGVNDVAVEAVEELKHQGWLADGTVARAYLRGASLHDANFSRDLLINKQDVALLRILGTYGPEQLERLWGADLRGVDLQDANLKGTNLLYVDLEEANLQNANLESANLMGANLQAAYLKGANLKECNLQFANLEKAIVSYDQLAQASCLEMTVLFDGTRLTTENWKTDLEEWYKKHEEDFRDPYEDADLVYFGTLLGLTKRRKRR